MFLIICNVNVPMNELGTFVAVECSPIVRITARVFQITTW
jgi:hypothetical protein